MKQETNEKITVPLVAEWSDYDGDSMLTIEIETCYVNDTQVVELAYVWEESTGEWTNGKWKKPLKTREAAKKKAMRDLQRFQEKLRK